MNELVYPRERMLGTISLILGILVWLFLIIGTFGVTLFLLAFGFVLYLFIHSTLISHIKGNGVELSETQFPDLHAQFINCCDRLQFKKRPQAFILCGDGGLNAFATKFLGSQYVVLTSDIVDAMNEHADGVRFYIGHELGHLRMKHLHITHLLRWPVLWLPLLGAAYSRARETTCDRHGLACSSSPEGAARALAALSAGSKRWQTLDVKSYLEQIKQTSGFWMSFHELTAGYPWLTKRAARVMDKEAAMPKRNVFAYFLAIFIPYAGRLGGGFGLLILLYIIIVLAAVAVPEYQNHTIKTKLSVIVNESKGARETLANYYQSKQEIPESLEAAGIPTQLNDGSKLSFDPSNMVLTVHVGQRELVFIPGSDEQGQVVWNCTNGQGLEPEQLPASCKDMPN
jgi:Zn-dependent protease with chaperone function/type II secretory pathway pseudopilin PulG